MLRKFVLATLMGVKQFLRTPLFLVLMVILPIVFIIGAFLRTPDAAFAVSVPEGALRQPLAVGMIDLHGAVMVPMTVAFLTGMAGLFVMLGARQGDHRLVVAGYSPEMLLGVRLLLITGVGLLITAVSVGVTLLFFRPEQLGLFFAVNLIQALQYGFLGAIAGTFLSSISGTYLMFFTPMIDVGIIQNPMFGRESVDLWAKMLPGYLPTEALMDVSFSPRFDSAATLALALSYLLATGLVAAILFRRVMKLRR